MAVIKISVPNPLDGTTSYNQIRTYEATDSSGTGATLVATVSIDTTTQTAIDPGFTTITYTSGATTKYYAMSYYNSTSTLETGYSDWVLGGQDRWDEMFKKELDDEAGTVWSTETRARFKRHALEALHPGLFRKVIDTSLVIDNDNNPTYTYPLPFGILDVSAVGIGDVNNATSTYQELRRDYWRVEDRTLHLFNIPATESGATIRLLATKKYLEVGEVPERYDEFVLYHLLMSAYTYLSHDFPRFKKWSKLQKGTGVSFENLRVQAREFERKFLDWKNRNAELGYPTDL